MSDPDNLRERVVEAIHVLRHDAAPCGDISDAVLAVVQPEIDSLYRRHAMVLQAWAQDYIAERDRLRAQIEDANEVAEARIKAAQQALVDE